MERILSSRMTPIAKFVLPAVFSGVSAWFAIMSFRSTKEAAYPGLLSFLSLLQVGVCLGGTVYFGQRAVRLRRVRMDDSGVVVSDYLTEVRVPFTEIADATYKRVYYSDVYMTLTFRQPTPLGTRAMFLLPRGAHPRALVNEIRRRGGMRTAI